MNALRQGGWFLSVGGAQWLLDWLLMVALSQAGVGLGIANVCGRIGGATLGFWLNGRITFRQGSRGLDRGMFVRYVVLWLSATVVSTYAVSLVGAQSGMRAAWIAKPVIDALLGIASFLVSRFWVYR